MIRINIYITQKQRELLKELTQNSLSISEHIRRAIDMYLAKQDRRKNYE